MAYLQDYLKDKSSQDVQGDHIVYWIPAVTFNQLPIKRWKYNRPPDESRIAEIREHLIKFKRVDGIIYLACINNEIVCYEANHRREAMKGVDGLHNILVDMMWNTTDEVIKQEFLRLNKAVSVPELFIEEKPIITYEELRDIVEEFCSNYKPMLSTRPHPQRPNFNKNNFMDDLYQIIKETKISPEELIDKLTLLNRQLQISDKSDLSPTVVKKCEENGLWLFARNKRLHASDLKTDLRVSVKN